MLDIAVMGCGAMGSVYAARLSAAGHRVLTVDPWEEHVRAISQSGLTLSGPDGEIVAPVQAYTSAPDRAVDLVILSTKAADVAVAARSMRGLIGPDTAVLTIQNGLGSAEVVAEHVDPGALVVGIASGFGAALVGPGHAHHNAMRALRFGTYDGAGEDTVEWIAQAWRAGGFDCQAVDDIAAIQWEKLICNVAYSAPCALTGLTVGEVLDNEEMSQVSADAATEAWEIARARGIAVDVPDPVALVRDFGAPMPDAKPSALLDFEAGRPSEIEFINGAIPREAAKINKRAPINAALTTLLRTRERAFTQA